LKNSLEHFEPVITLPWIIDVPNRQYTSYVASFSSGPEKAYMWTTDQYTRWSPTQRCP
jgi:hypothetical protein